MKKQIFILGALAIFSATSAQDLPQSSILSVIVNQFNSHFPKATDVEWEMQGILYNVEFETGWNVDHEVWYNNKGEIVKHKEDIPQNKLPKAVKNKLKSAFNGYTIDDLEQISEQGKVVYKMEMNSLLQQDWDVVMDAKGTIINKIAD
ncbi:MAG TPA: PepSY-like domain-containing protein [Flavobacterium sp.]|nr:PepSY-like domain-containing protein [Flavobacterium sp.]